MKKAVATKIKKNELNRLTKVFLIRLDSLVDNFRLTRTPIVKLYIDSLNKFDNFLKEKKITIKDNDIDKLDTKNQKIFWELYNEFRKNSRRIETVNRGILILLISELDNYLLWLIKYVFKNKKELFNVIKGNISQDELTRFKTIEEIQGYLLEIEVDNILSNKKRMFLWLENTFHINVKNAPFFTNILEIIERRNLYVHHDGYVNKQYLDNCKEILQKNIKFGKQLKISQDYVIEAFKNIKVFSMSLTYIILRQVLPNQLKESDTCLQGAYYHFFKKGYYQSAKELIDFLYKNFKFFSSNDFKLNLLVNMSYIHKVLKLKDWQKELEKINWEKQDKILRFVVAVLRENYNQASELMKDIGQNKIIIFGYEDWPILDQFRKTKTFKDTYKSVFNKQFKIQRRDDEKIDKVIKHIIDMKSLEK